MALVEDRRKAQSEAAAERFVRRATERRAKLEALQSPGGVAEANDPERVARRLDRLSRYYAGEELPATPGETPRAEPEQVLAAALERGHLPPRAVVSGESAAAAGVVLERIINTPDFVDIRYLEAGVAAARAVCRVRIRDQAGRVVGHGTGSLVSPRLLLTNHHVLETAEVAASSAAEFNFQDGLDGQPLRPQLLSLDPDALFVADGERDFALVAVRAGESGVTEFGFNPLVEAEGKAVIGEFVTIVQHPRGEKKQVSLRENRIVDLPETFMHYEADTEPGSSGSPVFNDQWEVVALHHASVPAPEHGELGGFLNEGIRISRILRFLGEQSLGAEQRALIEQLRAPERIVVPATPGPPVGPSPSVPDDVGVGGRISLGQGDQALSWSIPLELAIDIRTPATPRAEAPLPTPKPQAEFEALAEPFRDEDFSQRKGYDENFLGIKVPFLGLRDESLVSRLDDDSFSLPYEHFSIVVNKARRLALFTAANVDADPRRKEPEPGRDYTRRGLTGLGPNDQEKWFTDPRIPAIHQLPDRFFTKDRASFDKGHIVRREDVAWGDSFDELRRANGDTFHVTNCSPQVADFNRSNKKGVWGELENLILKQAAVERYCVFAGPVFRTDDRIFQGVDEAGPVRIAIPRQFWKVVVARSDSALRTFAFLLEQDLADTDLEFAVDKKWRTRMVSVSDLERLVGAASFPHELHVSDQIGASGGEAIRAETGIKTQ